MDTRSLFLQDLRSLAQPVREALAFYIPLWFRNWLGRGQYVRLDLRRFDAAGQQYREKAMRARHCRIRFHQQLFEFCIYHTGRQRCDA